MPAVQFLLVSNRQQQLLLREKSCLFPHSFFLGENCDALFYGLSFWLITVKRYVLLQITVSTSVRTYHHLYVYIFSFEANSFLQLVTSFSSEMKFFLLLKTFVVLLSPFLGFFGDDLEAKIFDRILRQNSIKFYYLHLQLHFVMHLLKLPP
jgi:hypothetical protein